MTASAINLVPVAKGYGASEPVADNLTDEGRQKNRRNEERSYNAPPSCVCNS